MEEDYPKTLVEFEHRFATNEACLDYLAQLRWGNSFTDSLPFIIRKFRLGLEYVSSAEGAKFAEVVNSFPDAIFQLSLLELNHEPKEKLLKLRLRKAQRKDSRETVKQMEPQPHWQFRAWGEELR